MKDTARKAVIEAWQKRKREEITHPFLNKKYPPVYCHMRRRYYWPGI